VETTLTGVPAAMKGLPQYQKAVETLQQAGKSLDGLPKLSDKAAQRLAKAAEEAGLMVGDFSKDVLLEASVTLAVEGEITPEQLRNMAVGSAVGAGVGRGVANGADALAARKTRRQTSGPDASSAVTTARTNTTKSTPNRSDIDASSQAPVKEGPEFVGSTRLRDPALEANIAKNPVAQAAVNRNPEVANTLADTAPKRLEELTPRERSVEVDLANELPSKPVRDGGDYVEKIELPNGHEWRRRSNQRVEEISDKRRSESIEDPYRSNSREPEAEGNGDWCRHSPNPNCPTNGRTPDSQINEEGVSTPVNKQEAEQVAPNLIVNDKQKSEVEQSSLEDKSENLGIKLRNDHPELNKALDGWPYITLSGKRVERTWKEYFEGLSNSKFFGQFDYESVIDEAAERIRKEGYDLTDDEAYTIFSYTTIYYYKNMNKWLREGNNVEITKAIHSQLNKSLDKLPSLDEHRIAYRGITLKNTNGGEQLTKFLSEHRKGEIVTYDDFVSASIVEKEAFKGNVQLIMEPKKNGKGKDINDLSFGKQMQSSEGEVLFKTQSSFKVLEVESQRTNVVDNQIDKPIKIYLQEI